MSKKKFFIIIAVILVAVLVTACLCYYLIPRYPFKNIEREDIESVTYIYGVGPERRHTLSNEETEKFVSCIQKIAIYNKQNEIADGYMGVFEIAMAEGETMTLITGGIQAIINKVPYRCTGESDQNLRDFEGKILSDYFDCPPQ